MAFNKTTHLKDNIAAIRVMFDLLENKQLATPSEQKILRKYCGFGGLKCILNPVQTEADIEKWPESEKILFPLVRELHQIIAERAPEEKERYINSIKESVLTAYYTPQAITSTISSTLNQLGVNAQRILEPSAGIGVFVDNVPFKQDKEVVAFEKDILSGTMLSLLYPDKDIKVAGFETLERRYENHFDLAISNVPFGAIRVFDPQYNLGTDLVKKAAALRIHNYFMVKSMDALREGGVMAFITTQNFLNSPENADVRYWLEENAKVLSAVRLPNNLFIDSANSEVGSDLIVLQKTKQIPQSVFKHTTKTISTATGSKEVNSCLCFADDKNVIFTDKKVGTDLYGRPAEVYTHSGGVDGITSDLAQILKQDVAQNLDLELFRTGLSVSAQVQTNELIAEVAVPQSLTIQAESEQVTLYDLFGFTDEERSQVAAGKSRRDTFRVQRMQEMQANYFHETQNRPNTPSAIAGRGIPAPQPIAVTQRAVQPPTPRPSNPAPEPYQWVDEIKEHYREGILVLGKDGAVGALTGLNDGFVIFNPILPKRINAEKAKAYIDLREAYNALYFYEADQQRESQELRAELNRTYDSFVVQYGTIRSNGDLMKFDSLGSEMSSLERLEQNQIVKADIFQQPVAFDVNKLGEIKTPDEALLASLNRFGKVKLSYMSYLLEGYEEEALLYDLENRLLLNPENQEFEIKERFLSGNVVEKAKMVKRYLDERPDDVWLKKSYDAVLVVRPEKITFGELDFNLGERWIPAEVYSAFATDLFGTQTAVGFNATLDDYYTHCKYGENANIRNRYAVKAERNYSGLALLQYALLNTTPIITKSAMVDGKKVKITDEDNTQLAASVIEQMRDAFPIWLQNQPEELKERLTDIYNDRFNCYVKAQYDGTHQKFPGLDLKGLGIPDLYKSQKDAVWMVLQNGGGIIDHEVGGGKTNILCVAAQELKRLKLAQKPMIIAMKANVQTIADNYRKAYPHARVLAPTEKDFDSKHRLALFNTMKNNNWDVVILSHDQFKAIPQSLAQQRRYFQEQLDEVEANLDVIKEQQGGTTKGQEKGLITRKLNLAAKLAELGEKLKAKRDNIVDFDKMGFDHILVDESHIFKNLSFSTRHSRVSGLGRQKGSQRADNLDIALRTIQRKTGRDLGATFLSGTTITNSLTELYLLYKYLRPQEMRNQGLRSFDAWAAVYAKKNADYEISSTGNTIFKERFRNFVKVPELAAFYNEITDFKTAKDIGIDRPEMNVVFKNIPQNDDQKEYTVRLMQFAATGDREVVGLPKADYKGNSDPRMLIATKLAGDMAMDMRFIDSRYEEQPDSKLAQCTHEIARYYKKFDEQKGTQFVFCNRRENTKTGWDFYEALKEKLVSTYGIPAGEIAFAQDYNTAKKKDILCDKMNAGEFRIVLGSTETLGTGINAQERAVALHHLDIPWKPSDLEQRDGRAVRKGNHVAKEFADNKVDVLVYAVQRSLDSYKFNLLQHKQTFINQLKTGTNGSRSLDEGAIDNDGKMQFASYMAELSGSTDLLDKVRLEKKINLLESESRAFHRGRENNKFELAQKKKTQETLEGQYTQMRADANKFSATVQRDGENRMVNHLRLDGVPEGSSVVALHSKLMEHNKNKRTNGLYERIGELYGFEVSVKSDYIMGQRPHDMEFVENRFYISSKGSTEHYTYNNGRIAVADPHLSTSNFLNALDSVAGIAERFKAKVDAGQKYIDDLSQVGYGEWPKKEELAALKKEHSEISERLKQSLKKYGQGGGASGESGLSASREQLAEQFINEDSELGKMVKANPNVHVVGIR